MVRPAAEQKQSLREMKIIRLTEKPSGTQIWLNIDQVNWFYQLTNDDGMSTKLEFNTYNVLVQETPEQVLRVCNED